SCSICLPHGVLDIMMPAARAVVAEARTLMPAISQEISSPVSKIAKILDAGAIKRNVNAGPMPAPLYRTPANSGTIVHEHTVRKGAIPSAIAYPVTPAATYISRYRFLGNKFIY
ncbi:MAG: hypothetical protein QXF31_00610, partial [Candidatus Bathyarchaeia archaeon]